MILIGSFLTDLMALIAKHYSWFCFCKVLGTSAAKYELGVVADVYSETGLANLFREPEVSESISRQACHRNMSGCPQ
jgi:hypothetical protein